MREITERLLPTRRLRSNPRVVKRKMSNWALNRTEHHNPPPPHAPTVHLVAPTKAHSKRYKAT
jgi:hypothetical protein